MTLRLLLIAGLLMVAAACTQEKPVVKMETSMGDIVLELNAEKAPITVKNFLAYVNEGSYNGTVFHRVIKNFMNQGGGFRPDFSRVPAGDAITNEADNGLKNLRGTIAMARTSAPHSATNQFFINTVDNAFLDHRSRDPAGWGYAVFGRVIEGMDVVDAMANVATGARGPFSRDVPLEDVVIIRVTQVQ